MIRGLIVLVLFIGGAYWVYEKVDWGSLLPIEKISNSIEKKMADAMWAELENKVVDSGQMYQRVDTLLTALCAGNSIPRGSIKLHILKDEQINAFAYPDRHMVVNEGLIKQVNNNDELIGVIAHEIAHMEQKHVFKKMIKEVGFGLVVNYAIGDIGGELIKNLLSTVTSTAYDRSLEKNADLLAVSYLKSAGFNPEYLAVFMDRLADQEPTPIQLSWLSTHPDSKERAAYIREEIQKSKGL